MKKLWIGKEKCTGCSACVNICAENAIQMKIDKSGFMYPVFQDQCIECGKCEEICKNRLQIQKYNDITPRVYAAWSRDKSNRFYSTSGGIFSEIAQSILERKGVVVGAGYNKDKMVEHIMIRHKSEVDLLRQSKYVQSEIGNIYRNIQEKLDEKKWVMFCGTPCQVSGLKSYLDKYYDYLITVDFICRGVNSPKAYKAWLNEIENEQKSKVKKVWFKYKDVGWKESPRCTRVDFENGKYEVYREENNTYMTGYLGPNLYIRPSCGVCDFKGDRRQSDITLADFWGIESKLDDNEGTSMLLVNSKKGMDLFETIKQNIFYFERNLKEVLKGNVCFENSVNISKQSENFLEDLDIYRFSKALKKYL